MNDTRITVVSPDRHHLGEIEGTLQQALAGSRIATIESTLQRVATTDSRLSADILIAECNGDDVTELAPLEQLGRQHPGMAFVILCKRQSSDFLIQAIRLGVREVLQSPVDAAPLTAAVNRICVKTGGPASRKGKVLAFVSCKGGSGATFLASNLAHVLAVQGEQKVALLDLNLQFGDALLLLTEQKAGTTLSDIVRDMHRLDPAFLASSMANVAPNLSVLAAPEDPAQAMEIKPEHIDALLKLACSQYDYVILDVGRNLDATTIRALDHADTIHAVLQAALPYVRGARRMLEVFRTLDYPSHKLELIVNRFEKSGELGLKDLEAALGTQIRRAIPNHYPAASASTNQGIPVNKLARSSPLSRSLVEWGEQLHHKPEADSGNWITRILKRA